MRSLLDQVLRNFGGLEIQRLGGTTSLKVEVEVEVTTLTQQLEQATLEGVEKELHQFLQKEIHGTSKPSKNNK